MAVLKTGDLAMDKNDEFCWLCHEDKASLNCTQCLRSFHHKCLPAKISDTHEIGWICLVCTKLKESEKQQRREYLVMLPKIVEHTWREKEFDIFKDPMKKLYLTADVNLVNPIDFYKIKEKANNYTSFDALMNDIDWMLHNVWILGEENPSHRKYTDALKELINFVAVEIEYMEKCPECYANWHLNDNYFALVCNRPHCIVWAKVPTHKYWPGKVMSVNGDQVHVRFFGDHSHADVPVNNCFLYSDESPDQRSIAKRQRRNSIIERSSISGPHSQAALDEIKLYFENFEKKFGPYQVAKKRTPFNPAMINQYMAKMMNGKQDLGQSNGSNGKDQFEASLNDLIDRFQSENSSLSLADDKDIVVDLLTGDEDDTLNSPENSWDKSIQEHSMGQEHTGEDVMDVGTKEQDKVVVNTEERVDSPTQCAENVGMPKPLKFILKRANVSTGYVKQTKRVRFTLEETPKNTQNKSTEGGEPDSTGNGDDGIGNGTGNGIGNGTGNGTGNGIGIGNGGEENGNGGDETGNGNGTEIANDTDSGDDTKNIQTVSETPLAEVKYRPSNNAKFIDLMPNLQTICETVENLLKANAELESKLTEAKKNEDILKNEVKLLNEKATNLEAENVEIQKQKVEEVKRAIENTKTDCETNSSKLIAEAKKKVYCVSCGTEKHELFACNSECWKDYWGQHFKMNQTL